MGGKVIKEGEWIGRESGKRQMAIVGEQTLPKRLMLDVIERGQHSNHRSGEYRILSKGLHSHMTSTPPTNFCGIQQRNGGKIAQGYSLFVTLTDCDVVSHCSGTEHRKAGQP
jgi:hypothetical protein